MEFLKTLEGLFNGSRFRTAMWSGLTGIILIYLGALFLSAGEDTGNIAFETGRALYAVGWAFMLAFCVRVVNESADKNCAWYSRALNETFTAAMSTLDLGVSSANTIEKDKIKKIASVIVSSIENTIIRDKDANTLKQVLASGGTEVFVIKFLKENNIITNINKLKYLQYNFRNKEELTEDGGYPLVKYFMFGCLFNDKDIVSIVNKSKLNIELCFSQLIRIKNFDNEYNFLPQLQEAIYEQYQNKGTDASTRCAQLDVFSGKHSLKRMICLCWKLLEMTDWRIRRQVLDRYCTIVENLDGNYRLWNIKKISPTDALVSALTASGTKEVFKYLADNKLNDGQRIAPYEFVINIEQHIIGKKPTTMIRVSTGKNNDYIYFDTRNVENYSLDTQIAFAMSKFLSENKLISEKNISIKDFLANDVFLFEDGVIQFLLQQMKKHLRTTYKFQIEGNNYFKFVRDTQMRKSTPTNENALFDGKKITLADKIKNWFMADFNKKYRWEK